MGFSPEAVATFIAVVGVLSVAAQTAILGKCYFIYSSFPFLLLFTAVHSSLFCR